MADITHSSPSVPMTSSFWHDSSHATAASYANHNPTNETDHCYMKNLSSIGSDTRIWIKSSGGGFAKSVTELSNGFDKNTVFNTEFGGFTNPNTYVQQGTPTKIEDVIANSATQWSGSITYPNHGDLYSIYSVGKDWDVVANPTSSRFVFVNGVLTKRNYEFDVFNNDQSCINGTFPTLDLPSDQILFRRENYGDEPVRAIMFISHSRIVPSEGAAITEETQISESINYCRNNNLGWYYTSLNTPGNPAPAHNWITPSSVVPDQTAMLVKALTHYCPWYTFSSLQSGSITFLPIPQSTEGLIDNMGDTYFINRKIIGDPSTYSSSCKCCDTQGYEINQAYVDASKGYVKNNGAQGGLGKTAYWYDWNHYSEIWNGTYIAADTQWDIPTAEIASYGSSIKETDYTDCGCSKNSNTPEAYGSVKLTVHGTRSTSSATPLVNSDTLNSYMTTDTNNLITKRPDCECNTITGWKNTSLDDCSPQTADQIFTLRFSDGYEFTAGAYARLISHNHTQRNNMSASATAENSKWPYQIDIPSVIEIYNNADTYTQSATPQAFIKCADLYPGTTHTTGHVFLTNITRHTGSLLNAVTNDLLNKGQKFLDALGDSEFDFVDYGVARNPAVIDAFQKHSHMTTFKTSFPRSKFAESIFSGCVMIENGLYVLFEDFCEPHVTGSGCTDYTANNYDWQARTDDGSCSVIFTNTNLFQKLYQGSYRNTPATFSSAPIEDIYNYDTDFDININGVDVWNVLNGGGPGATRFFSPVSKSIFTTDGFNIPIFANSFSYVSRSLCDGVATHSGSYFYQSAYYEDIVANRLDISSTLPLMSSSLYSFSGYVNSDANGGPPYLNNYRQSNYPFTSAPTGAISYEWSYSNTASTNVSFNSQSAYAGFNTFLKSEIQSIKYFDVSASPYLVVNNYDDLSALGGLEYLKLSLPPIAPTTLDFTANKNLKNLVISGSGDLIELDVSTNKLLETIKLTDSCSTGGHLTKLHFKNACHLTDLSIINCLSTSSTANFDIELYGAGSLQDLTIVGGALKELDLTRNTKLINVAISELSSSNTSDFDRLDVSCAGSNLQTLFLANTNISFLHLGVNTQLKALSVADTLISTPIDLAPNVRLRSLSYRNCNFGGGELAESHLPSSLIDLDLSNTNIIGLDLDAGPNTNLENLIVNDNPLLVDVVFPHANSSLINVSMYNTDCVVSSSFTNQNKIEMLNLQHCRISESIYWPTTVTNINVNDNPLRRVSPTSNYGTDANPQKWTFNVGPYGSGAGSLNHVEIERTNTRLLEFGQANRLKHLLASGNHLAFYATASITYDGTLITSQFYPTVLGSIGGDQLVNPTSINYELANLNYLSILDVSDQEWNNAGTSATYLDLSHNRNLRVLLAKNNSELQAVRFVSHSLLRYGDPSPVPAGTDASTMTIDLTGCSNFTHFLVNDTAHSASLMYLDSQGYIKPTKAAGGWNIAVSTTF